MMKKESNSFVDDAIEQVASEMKYEEPGTEKFAALAQQLDQLYKTKKNVVEKPLFSPDILLTVGGNLLGIGLILSYERVNVIATKALGFVLKNRI